MARARRPTTSRKTLFALPPLELECMKALWSQGEASVREIREQLSASGRTLAYTTVETIMDRLARKGAVARHKVGRAHRYTPVYQAAEARAQAVQAMAQHFFGGSRRADRPHRIRLENGDVAVWGGPARLAFHGVEPLADGDDPLTGRCRINLTFRKAL